MTKNPWEEFTVFVSRNFNAHLTEKQTGQLRIFYDELVDCNRRFNLTALTSEKDVLYYHFADSLAAAPAISEILKTNQSPLAADIGSGAGFPGIPLKIVFPAIQMTLIESNKKKCLFLDYVKGKIGLNGTHAVCGRAEELGSSSRHSAAYDLVFNRALADFEKAYKLSLPFAKSGGRLFFWQTKTAETENVAGAFEYSLPGTMKTRYIRVAEKR